MSNSYEPLGRDEFDLWAESSEESARKQSELGSLKFLNDLDKWISEGFDYVDSEVQSLRGMGDD